MTRATAQNGDLDFEQMMGELAAMKTDLAQRQASRSGSRPSTPRTGASDAEPRRARTRRTPAEIHAETSTPADTEASAVLPPSSPLIKASTALETSTQSSEIDTKVEQVQEQVQPEAVDDLQEAKAPEKSSDHSIHAHTTIEAATSSSVPTSNTISSDSDAVTTIAQSSESQGTDTSSSVTPPSSGGSTLTRSESRRNTAVPLPQKSAQRSRSISHGSSRLSQTSHSDLNESIREAVGSETSTAIPEEVSTPTFGPTVPPPRKFLRPYPSSPALSSTNGQMAPASPRLPARSNSRNYHKPTASNVSAHAPANTDQTPQGSPLMNQAPVIPPRTRSGSKSLSRSNTLNRSEGSQDPGSPYIGTPTITEDSETAPDSPQAAVTAISSSEQQQQQHQQPLDQLQQQQTTLAASEDALRNVVASDPSPVVSHMRKKSSISILKPVSEAQERQGHSLAPSLLPAEPIPSPSASASSTPSPEHEEGDQHDSRPVIRKQKSVDPASMYRQHQQDLVRDRLPSRHASERRPNRDRNPSQQGSSPFMEVRENSHSREPSGDSQQTQERGRSHKKEESSSKGGIFAWVRSRSKSRDVSSSKPTYDTSHPVPEQTFEYNPALIPSRSGSAAGNQRAKSLPRKASNQNFHVTSDGWPPYSPGDMKADGSSHQRNKSITRVGLNPPPFGGVSSSGDTSAPQLPALSASTNMSTVHHENMIRGMGMGSTPISPAVLLTPQPSFPTTPGGTASGGGMRGVALAMMKNDGSPSSSEQQMQQRHLQLQQAQMQHIQQQQQQQQQMQQQQQRLAISTAQQQQQSSSETPASPRAQQNAAQGPMSPTAATPVTQRLVATRIYIQTETDFKSVNLAPNSTALDALHMLQQRGCFGEPGDGRYHDRWTIFEYSKEFMIERPLRDFEVILDVIKTWEADKDNKMICKSFPARDELSAQEVVRLVGPEGQANFVRPHGWVHLEIKKSKWVKRYLHITDTAVYHSKDQKFNGESMLCLLRNFDVYAVQVPRKKAPTKFGFALKSSDKIHLFETPEDDYIHYICTDSGENLREWLAGLRAAKGMFMYHANPEVIREGQKHAAELQAASGHPDGKGKGNLTEEQQAPTATIEPGLPQGVTSATPASTANPSVPVLPITSLHSPATSSPRSQQILQRQESAILPAPAASPLKDTFSLAPSALGLATPPLSSPHSQTSSPPTLNVNLNLHLGLDLDINPDSACNDGNLPTNASNSLKTNTAAIPTTITATTTATSDISEMDTMAASKNPFMTGSLLQQRVEAEKQEIENMKMQLRMREQAGILGTRGMSDHQLLQPHNASSYYQQGGHGRGLSSGSAVSATSSSSAHSLIQPQQQPKFGGPGTLIEKGEARAAKLLERSKSSGTGLLRPSHAMSGNNNNSSSSSSSSNAYNNVHDVHRARSKSRGQSSDDRSYYVQPTSPHSPGSSSPMGTPAMPQGPLLYFADGDAMIQPGLLLDRAKSTKQQQQQQSSSSSQMMMRSPGGQYPGSGAGSRGRTPSAVGNGSSSSSHHLLGGQNQGRTRQKPLIDLGNLNTSHDMIGPGLLTGAAATAPSGSQSARSPRRQKPLLDF